MIWVKMRRDTSFVANPSRFDIFKKKIPISQDFQMCFISTFTVLIPIAIGYGRRSIWFCQLLDTGQIQHRCLWDRLGDDGGGAWNTPVDFSICQWFRLSVTENPQI